MITKLILKAVLFISLILTINNNYLYAGNRDEDLNAVSSNISSRYKNNKAAGFSSSAMKSSTEKSYKEIYSNQLESNQRKLATTLDKINKNPNKILESAPKEESGEEESSETTVAVPKAAHHSPSKDTATGTMSSGPAGASVIKFGNGDSKK